MKRALIVFSILFLALVLTSQVNANFACGQLNDAEDFSSVWENVIVYYQENISSKTYCKVSSENKYCCDLEQIKGITWKPGKLVFAEVFNQDLGYFAGPVSGLTTEDGYFVLPDMQLKKVITFNQPISTIQINNLQVLFNLTLDENFNNLKYKLNDNPEKLFCEECINPEFYLQLQSGKNKIILTAYNEGLKEISEELIIFSLNSFKIKDSFECDKCTKRGNNFYVPSDSKITLKLELESSHDLFEEISVLVPLDWSIPFEYFPEDYSETHNLLKWNLSETSKTFELTSSQTTFKRKDYFIYELGDFSQETKVNVYNFMRFFPFVSNKKPSESKFFTNSVKNMCDKNEPLILEFEEEPFDLIAIYPKEDYSRAHAYVAIKQGNFFNRNEISFNLLTNIPLRKIDKVLYRFKVPKQESIELYSSSGKVFLEMYSQDDNYNYYEVYLTEKGNFKIKFF